MKQQVLMLLLTAATTCTTVAQDSLRMTALFHWDDASLPDAGADGSRSYSDCWGYWRDGREYAVIGSSSMTHFWDVTDPENSTEIGRFSGEVSTVWREYKSYRNERIYGVSDNTTEGLFIFDVTGSPDTVRLTAQTKNFFQKAHMLFIDEVHGRLYATGTDTRNDGLIVLDIASDPDNPTLLASVSLPGGGYVHDVYVRNHIAYCSHGYKGLYVWDMTNPSAPVLMAEQVTNGYNHASWMSPDGRYLVNAEEVPAGLPLLMFDLDNAAINELDIISRTKTPLEAPSDSNMIYHNPYFTADNEVVVSAYEDGVLMYDVTDPTAPKLKAYYDTYPENEGSYNGYKGCWGVYPFLPSGRLIASDIQNGLFVIEPRPNDLTDKVEDIALEIWPNPATDYLEIFLQETVDGRTTVRLHDALGQTLINSFTDGNLLNLQVGFLPAGVYFLEVTNGMARRTERVMVGEFH